MEIGARGHRSARRAFQSLGLTSREANKLLKSLSVVAARCSLSIFLSHKESHWSPKDLVVIETPPVDAMPMSQKSVPVSHPAPPPVDVTEPVVDVLRRYGCLTLFHFTDASNVESIRKHGLLSASSITKQEIVSTMNSDDLSRTLDQACGLQDYVRLSFNANNLCRREGKEDHEASNRGDQASKWCPALVYCSLTAMLRGRKLLFLHDPRWCALMWSKLRTSFK